MFYLLQRVFWTIITITLSLSQPSEVQAIVANDRSSLFANGVTLAGRKCTVLRDALNVDGQNTMDIKMKTSEKEPEPFSFTIGKTIKGERANTIQHAFTLNIHISVQHQQKNKFCSFLCFLISIKDTR